MMKPLLAAALLLVLCLPGCAPKDKAGDDPGPRWYKGNLHTHSLWSDGDDFPEHIALWYRERGYDFLAISDHNTAQTGEKWMKYADIHKKGAGPAVDRYLKAFAHAKSRGDRAAGTQEIRLTPFAEYKPLIERPGQFLLIQSEEISDKLDKRPIHMNATNAAEPIKPQGGKTVVEIIRNNFQAVKEQGQRLNRPVLPHLNHPNFQWGVTAEELAEVVEERFFEVYNGHPSINHMGDHQHPTVERIWDIANSLRIKTFKAPPLYGLGTDDSHHYHVEGVNRSAPGRGWIRVRAEALTPEALIAAMERGDFYASTGVTLRDVRYDETTKTLTIDIQPQRGAKYITRFVGCTNSEIGVTFAETAGTRAAYTLRGHELYVRAVITSDQHPASPSFDGHEHQQAWTQPVGWEPLLKKRLSTTAPTTRATTRAAARTTTRPVARPATRPAR